ncbi:MAG: efflux RND transporter periplasmic adaptor subunit [Gammaproteobacteria bacterium]
MSQFLVLPCLIIVYTLWSSPGLAGGDNEQTEKINRIDGYPAVVLDNEIQKISGIETAEAELAAYRPEFIAFGSAINIQPLLALRHSYLRALTDSRSAGAKLTRSEQSIRRTEDLYRSGIAAKRRLEEQQSQWRVDRSLADAAQFQSRTIISEGLLLWGKELTDWATAADSGCLDDFVSGKKTLLQITLPAGKQLPDNVRTIFVEVSGDRSKAQEARLISKAPQIDNTVQGAGYFFETDGQGVPVGMHVSAFIPEQKDPVPGVVIPKSSVIWSMGQAFVYIKNDEDQFNRRILRQAKQTPGGYFVGESVKAGEEIVTSGGQMLLSEELRGQIPDEDD